MVIGLGLVDVIEVAALLLAGVGVGLQVVGAAVVGEDAKGGDAARLGAVQLDGVILVAVGLDVGDLEHRFLDDLKVLGEGGGVRLAGLPCFHRSHDETPHRAGGETGAKVTECSCRFKDGRREIRRGRR